MTIGMRWSEAMDQAEDIRVLYGAVVMHISSAIVYQYLPQLGWDDSGIAAKTLWNFHIGEYENLGIE